MKSIFPRLLLALEFLLYAALTAVMLHATWLTWPDAFIDFSRELYLPWRVACGDVLYRDLAYYFGPLSVYANAALFAILGRPSIHALFALNFAFWMATLLALRALLCRIASPLAATLAVSAFILLFSFNRYLGVGNYNFLAPYSHEITRGFLLAILALLSLDSALRHRSPPLALLAGFLLGLALFTKPEIALAAVFSTTVLFLSRFLGDAESCRVLPKHGGPVRDENSKALSPSSTFHRFLFIVHCRKGCLCLALAAFAAGLLLALALVVAPFAAAFHSVSQALHHTLLKLYLDCFNPALTSLPFFKTVMGADDISAHALRLLRGTAFAAAPFMLARVALPRLPSRPLRRAATVLLVLAAAAIGWFAFFSLNPALPVAPVLFAVASLRGGGRPARGQGSGAKPLPGCAATPANRPLALAFAVLSLALVSKIFLNCGISHYGFVLALPAFCCTVLLACHSPRPPARTAIAAALILGFSAAALRLQTGAIRQWDVSHAVHDGVFLAARFQADAFNAALDWIRANTPPDSTLAVLPEGAVLNVLSGRPNSTPYVSLPPTDWPRYDEAAVLAAFSNSPPDTLVLVRKLEPGQFGLDYAQSLMAFLDPLYSPAITFTLSTPTGPLPYILVATRVPSP